LAILFATELEIISMSETPVILRKNLFLAQKSLDSIKKNRKNYTTKTRKTRKTTTTTPATTTTTTTTTTTKTTTTTTTTTRLKTTTEQIKMAILTNEHTVEI
jgi:hypothetical protein